MDIDDRSIDPARFNSGKGGRDAFDNARRLTAKQFGRPTQNGFVESFNGRMT